MFWGRASVFVAFFTFFAMSVVCESGLCAISLEIMVDLII
jgi:hypothetical protein